MISDNRVRKVGIVCEEILVVKNLVNYLIYYSYTESSKRAEGQQEGNRMYSRWNVLLYVTGNSVYTPCLN